MTRPAVVGIALVVLAGCSEEQRPGGPGDSKSAVVSIAGIQADSIPPGGETTVVVRLRIASGYHVQANPAADEFLVPLEVTIASNGGLTLGDPTYPPPRRHRLAGADTDLLTYEGSAAIELPVSAARDVAPGKTRVTGEIRYQACDANTCYFPANLPVAFEIDVAG